MIPNPPCSSRRAYLEWVEAQVEEYKESICRDELLALAEGVIRELGVTGGGQYQLTEVLLCSAVDRHIVRRLGLPRYGAWRAAVEAGMGTRGVEMPLPQPLRAPLSLAMAAERAG